MGHMVWASDNRKEEDVNLKDLTDVKEYCDYILDELSTAREAVEQELNPDSDAGEMGSTGESPGEIQDVPPDPLEDALAALERVHEMVGEVLNVTEPYRKRYQAARDDAAAAARNAPRRGARRSRQHNESVAKEEEVDGEVEKPTSRGRTVIRPFRTKTK